LENVHHCQSEHPPLQSAAKRQKTQQHLQVVVTKQFTPAVQHDLGLDMCNVFVSCGFPWNAAHNPELLKFFQKWLPGAVVPDRHQLSGSFLKERVTQVEGQMKQQVEGKLATGQCDGWKNISKTPLIAMMMTVEYQV
jgi:hypothetical protein